MWLWSRTPAWRSRSRIAATCSTQAASWQKVPPPIWPTRRKSRQPIWAHKPALASLTQYDVVVLLCDASIIVGAFVLSTAVAIFWDSLNKVYDYFAGKGNQSETTVLALAVVFFTIIVKIILSWYTSKVGKENSSSAITAVAKDHRNDILSAGAAGVGILFNLLGFLWIDPLAGAFVALFILKTGVQIIRDSAEELMRTSPESSVYREIERNVKQISGVDGIEEVYVQYFGMYMMINITIFVNGEISVREGDLVADKVEEILYKNIEYLKKVNVHFHPKN